MVRAARPRPSRALGVLLLGAVLGSTAYLLVITVTPVLAERFLSGSAWIGVPNASLIVGVAFGAPALSWLIPRIGRIPALALGFAVTALACVGASVFAGREAFGPFVLSCLLLGAGYAAYHLVRYAAALLVPPHRRGRAVGLVVWAAVAASFAAPFVFSWIERLAASVGDSAIGLTYLVSAALYASVAVLFLASRALRVRRAFGPASASLPPPAASGEPAAPDDGPPPGEIALGVVGMVSAHAAMMVMMTMTPVQVVAAGGTLTGLGAIMGAHTLGMFLLSPLVGVLSDRFGERAMIAVGGLLLTASGILGAVAPLEAGALMGFALYLLGLGWCFGFVAASALLARGPNTPVKVRRQGRADSLNWSVAALASVASGLLMNRLGFGAVAGAAALLGSLAVAAALFLGRARGVSRRRPGSAFRGSFGGGSRAPQRTTPSPAP